MNDIYIIRRLNFKFKKKVNFLLYDIDEYFLIVLSDFVQDVNKKTS